MEEALQDGGALWIRLRVTCCDSVEQRVFYFSVCLYSVFESVNAAHVQLELVETPCLICLPHKRILAIVFG